MIDNFDIAKSLLEQNGEITGLTAGGSMKPLFRSGKDKAVVVPITCEFKVGDVLLYRAVNQDALNLHRVVKMTENGPILRGDSLFFDETNIPKANIIGILKGFYRQDKYYDCQKSLCYKLYTLYIRLSYPLRLFCHKVKYKLKHLLKYAQVQ